MYPPWIKGGYYSPDGYISHTERWFLTQGSLGGEQRRICGHILQEMWDFSFWGLFTFSSLVVLSSVMRTSSHLESEILNCKGCGNLQISSGRKLGFTVWGTVGEMGKWILPPAYSVDPCKILCFKYTSEGSPNRQHYWQKTSVAPGRENINSKIPKKVNTWIAVLFIHGVFLTC